MIITILKYCQLQISNIRAGLLLCLEPFEQNLTHSEAQSIVIIILKLKNFKKTVLNGF